MKPTQGYLTEDGTFFESKKEAALYEAEIRLRDAFIERYQKGDVEVFMTIVRTLRKQIGDYCNVYFTPSPVDITEPNTPAQEPIGEADDSGPPTTADDRPRILTGTEEDIASVLKLPTRRHRNVSDVGSSPSTEEIPDRGPLYGAGVRFDDA